MPLVSDRKHSLPRRLTCTLVFCAAAVATGNWIDIALWPEQPYYGNAIVHALLYVALIASVTFAIAGLVAIWRLRRGVALGVLAVFLAWSYFGPFAFAIPWSDLAWFVSVQYHGGAQLTALVSLWAATIHTIVEFWLKVRRTTADPDNHNGLGPS